MYVLRLDKGDTYHPQYFTEDSGRSLDRHIANSLENASKYDSVGDLVEAVVRAEVQNHKEDHPRLGLHNPRVIEVENKGYAEVGEVA